MLNVLVVARKELVDHLRDVRAMASTGLYALMGPIIVWLVLLVSSGEGEGPHGAAISLMAAVFTLVSAFIGGNSVAIDMIAGERERRSLLPLLLNSVSRTEITVGKWLATGAFAMCSALVTLFAFVVVFAVSRGLPNISIPALLLVPSLLFLALFAAALELLVSTWCRNVKEANTYLTILIFVVMGLSIWLAFSPDSAEAWWFLVPVAGHQYLLQAGLVDAQFPAVGGTVLAGVSMVGAALALVLAGNLFQRDAIVYGD